MRCFVRRNSYWPEKQAIIRTLSGERVFFTGQSDFLKREAQAVPKGRAMVSKPATDLSSEAMSGLRQTGGGVGDAGEGLGLADADDYVGDAKTAGGAGEGKTGGVHHLAHRPFVDSDEVLKSLFEGSD